MEPKPCPRPAPRPLPRPDRALPRPAEADQAYMRELIASLQREFDRRSAASRSRNCCCSARIGLVADGRCSGVLSTSLVANDGALP